ncbi:MAG TPA: NUDIX hydrolase [Terriglobia bacterium]|jgi:8-oxo-dGTP pyrophosphatase MutT (NUDIX family)
METNPWKSLSSDVVYENRWIRVTEHQVINPAGSPGIYGVVHFKHLAVGVVPWEDGYIWLVGQFRLPLERYSWEIPEGGGSRGQDPLESAKRELKEETGMTADDWEIIVRMDLSNSVSDEEAIVYLAKGLQHGTSQPDETEQLSVRKVSLDEAFEMVENGEIRDAITVAAVYKMVLLRTTGLF